MKPQWQLLLDKFHDKGNVLHTGDFRDDPHLYNEWRRTMCDLRNRGFKIESFKATPKVWVYRLQETQPELLQQ